MSVRVLSRVISLLTLSITVSVILAVRSIPFLDTFVTIKNGVLHTDFYRKLTDFFEGFLSRDGFSSLERGHYNRVFIVSAQQHFFQFMKKTNG